MTPIQTLAEAVDRLTKERDELRAEVETIRECNQDLSRQLFGATGELQQVKDKLAQAEQSNLALREAFTRFLMAQITALEESWRKLETGL